MQIAGAPDQVPRGATWVNVDIFGDGSQPQPPGMYEKFVTDRREREKFGEALLYLANVSGPALYHCEAGKDRTGWTSMLLQTIAGVPQAVIMRDYLASNNYFGQTVVEQGWLQAGFDKVNEMYGSMNAYLMQGIGLTQADIYVLRGKMVYFAELPGKAGLSAMPRPVPDSECVAEFSAIGPLHRLQLLSSVGHRRWHALGGRDAGWRPNPCGRCLISHASAFMDRRRDLALRGRPGSPRGSGPSLGGGKRG